MFFFAVLQRKIWLFLQLIRYVWKFIFGGIGNNLVNFWVKTFKYEQGYYKDIKLSQSP